MTGAPISSLLLLSQMTTNIAPSSSTNRPSYSSGSRMPSVSFSGLKSRRPQGCAPSASSRGESVFLASSGFQRLCAFPGSWSCLSQTSASVVPSPTLSLTRSSNDSARTLGPPGESRQPPCFTIVNLTHLQSPCYHVRSRIHRFQELRCGHIGGTIILSTTGLNKYLLNE